MKWFDEGGVEDTGKHSRTWLERKVVGSGYRGERDTSCIELGENFMQRERGSIGKEQVFLFSSSIRGYLLTNRERGRSFF